MKTALLLLLVATFTIYIMRKGIHSIASRGNSTEDHPYLVRMLIAGTITSTAFVVAGWVHLRTTGEWPPHIEQFDGDWPYWFLAFAGGFGFCAGSLLGLLRPMGKRTEPRLPNKAL